ncbi:hypothetical protein FACS1894219_02440 [Clostridia bacterium]|nr:hypothetical protein FACS1894219_02440 [Clostridia bacterium]
MRIKPIIAALILSAAVAFTACENNGGKNDTTDTSATTLQVTSEEDTGETMFIEDMPVPGEHRYTLPLTFPISEIGKTDDNASVFEIAPFTISVDLPTGWSLKEAEINQEGLHTLYSGAFSVVDFYDRSGAFVGSAGYNTFEVAEDSEYLPAEVYNQIGLGNDYHFVVRDEDEGEFIQLEPNGTTYTAVTDVIYSDAFVKGLTDDSGEAFINKGILSYDRTKHVYVAFEFASDVFTQEELEEIAASIVFAD